MNELKDTELMIVAGGNPSSTFEQMVTDAGYAVGYAAGYFYNSVMISDAWIDDLASYLAD